MKSSQGELVAQQRLSTVQRGVRQSAWLSRENHFPLLDMTDPDVVEMNESIVIDERTMTGGRRRTTVERPIVGCCQSPIGGCYLISSVIRQS
ncbi:hypothetical protein CCHR01_02986 [Colletotrichum chrysophilum]|uniref:Uncharacterized protein n=1 Tax=Colletotrichum chrysophilum TaxID=1836956 RepID=A0AAD9AXA5_9PEZI|nr:hypothetical protein CCHR01_02986 [Colletotrichum chrysophilum]